MGYFTFTALDFFASYNYQLEAEDPILLRRFFDCVRWSSIYPIWYNIKEHEFYGLFVPWRWDRMRGLKTDRIVFNEKGLNDNIMVFDTKFKPCRLSELQVGL